MILIACIDENNGMLFNNRRQSRDKKLIMHILNLIGGKKIWINNFTKELFDVENNRNVIVDENFINKMKDDDFCFIENISPSLLENKIDKMILYNWGRKYPADKYFDIKLSEWFLESENEIEGSSHEKIIQKIYTKEKLK